MRFFEQPLSYTRQRLTDMRMRAGEEIQGAIDEIGMSQSQLARLSGVSRGQINSIINGKNEPQRSTLGLLWMAINKARGSLKDDMATPTTDPRRKAHALLDLIDDGEMPRITAYLAQEVARAGTLDAPRQGVELREAARQATFNLEKPTQLRRSKATTDHDRR